jgi:TPP-dependent pyruvate/acetoin dehydrogenase alpha subunit
VPKNRTETEVAEVARYPHNITNRKYEGLTEADYPKLLYYMKLTRASENRIVKLYRQGKVVGGVYLGTGMEATSVGSAYPLDHSKGDALFPLIRDLGAMFTFGMSPRTYFCQYLNKACSPTKGKDGNIHLTDPEHNIVGMISHLSAMIPPAVGWAWALKMRGTKGIAINYIGNGGAQVGDFHEGLNFAAVIKAPFILMLENNQYAYSTPNEKQYACKNLSDRALGYGIPGYHIDGNNVLEVAETVHKAVQHARAGNGPSLIEAVTMRMRGHSEHDDHKYVPKELLDEWSHRDPIERFTAFLLEKGTVDEGALQKMEQRINGEVEEAMTFAENAPGPDPAWASQDVYAP